MLERLLLSLLRRTKLLKVLYVLHHNNLYYCNLKDVGGVSGDILKAEFYNSKEEAEKKLELLVYYVTDGHPSHSKGFPKKFEVKKVEVLFI